MFAVIRDSDSRLFTTQCINGRNDSFVKFLRLQGSCLSSVQHVSLFKTDSVGSSHVQASSMELTTTKFMHLKNRVCDGSE